MCLSLQRAGQAGNLSDTEVRRGYLCLLAMTSFLSSISSFLENTNGDIEVCEQVALPLAVLIQ